LLQQQHTCKKRREKKAHITRKEEKVMAMSRRFSARTLAVIDESARLVFGNRPVLPYRTGFSVFKRLPYGPIAANYYVPNMAPQFRKFGASDFKTDLEERREEKLMRLRAKNKGPPKKGEGKRAKKRVKK
jgi:hypothetical protein